MVCLSRQCHFKFFKGCLPQISPAKIRKNTSMRSMTITKICVLKYLTSVSNASHNETGKTLGKFTILRVHFQELTQSLNVSINRLKLKFKKVLRLKLKCLGVSCQWHQENLPFLFIMSVLFHSIQDNCTTYNPLKKFVNSYISKPILPIMKLFLVTKIQKILLDKLLLLNTVSTTCFFQRRHCWH